MKGYIDADALLTPIFVERERRESRMQTVKAHVHNFYEMYVLLDGQIDKFVESRTYHLKPFDLIIIPPNRLHKSILCKDYRHERVVIYFDERSVHDAALLRRLDQDLGVITLPNDAAKRVFKLINILLQEKESSAWHESYVSGVLTEMLVVILRSERGGKLPYAGVRFEKIIDYVKENCREPDLPYRRGGQVLCERRAPEPHVPEKHGLYLYAVCQLSTRHLCADAADRKGYNHRRRRHAERV